MAKIIVKVPFHDQYTHQLYRPGDKLEFEDERAKACQTNGLVEIVEEKKAEKAEKTEKAEKKTAKAKK